MVQTLNAAIITAALLAFLLIWSYVGRRIRNGMPVIRWTPRRAVEWDLVDIGLMIIAVPSFSLLAVFAVRLLTGCRLEQLVDMEGLPSSTAALQVAGQSIGSLMVMVTGVMVIWARHPRLADFGFSRGGWRRDMRLGAATFFALAPLVYGLQFMLVKWVESKHPLIELLKRDHDSALVATVVVSAVVVAPIVEEFLFRVLLQGWLESAAAGWRTAGNACRGDRPAQQIIAHPSDGPKATEADRTTFAVLDSTGDANRQEDPADKLPERAVPYWPIAVSSVTFGLMHWSHGPDFAPLILLAVGLGYLYRQTHRILPCIVVHLLLNLLSMTGFLIDLYSR